MTEEYKENFLIMQRELLKCEKIEDILDIIKPHKFSEKFSNYLMTKNGYGHYVSKHIESELIGVNGYYDSVEMALIVELANQIRKK